MGRPKKVAVEGEAVQKPKTKTKKPRVKKDDVMALLLKEIEDLKKQVASQSATASNTQGQSQLEMPEPRKREFIPIGTTKQTTKTVQKSTGNRYARSVPIQVGQHTNTFVDDGKEAKNLRKDSRTQDLHKSYRAPQEKVQTPCDFCGRMVEVYKSDVPGGDILFSCNTCSISRRG